MDYFSKGEYILGRYLVNEVSTSRMSVLYFCYDSLFERPTAIKTFRFESVDQVENLSDWFIQGSKRWIMSGSELGIVEAYDVFHIPVTEDLNVPYLSMEFVKGHPKFGNSLKEWIQNSRLDLQLTLYIAHSICSGMIIAQKKLGSSTSDFVHYNLKPQNILISHEGSIKISDIGFGEGFKKTILKGMSLNGSNKTEYSNSFFGITNAAFGTAPYMSPEQSIMMESCDRRSDIYSFGCILYEMCTKKYVFQAESTEAFIMKHIHEKPIPPKELNPKIPKSLDKLIQDCLAKNPDDRPQKFEKVRDSIGGIIKSEGMPSGIGFWLFGLSFFSENPRVRSDHHMNEEEEIYLLGKSRGFGHLIKQGLIEDEAEWDKIVIERESSALKRSAESKENILMNEVYEHAHVGDSLIKLAESSNDPKEEEKIIRSALSKYHSADRILRSNPHICFRLGLAYFDLSQIIRKQNIQLHKELIRLAINRHNTILNVKMTPTLDLIGNTAYILPYHALWHRAAAYAAKENFEEALQDLKSLLSWIDEAELPDLNHYIAKLKENTNLFIDQISDGSIQKLITS